MTTTHICFGELAAPIEKALGLEGQRIRSIDIHFAFDEPTTIAVTRLATVEEIAMLTKELQVMRESYQLQKVEDAKRK